MPIVFAAGYGFKKYAWPAMAKAIVRNRLWRGAMEHMRYGPTLRRALRPFGYRHTWISRHPGGKVAIYESVKATQIEREIAASVRAVNFKVGTHETDILLTRKTILEVSMAGRARVLAGKRPRIEAGNVVKRLLYRTENAPGNNIMYFNPYMSEKNIMLMDKNGYNAFDNFEELLAAIRGL